MNGEAVIDTQIQRRKNPTFNGSTEVYVKIPAPMKWVCHDLELKQSISGSCKCRPSQQRRVLASFPLTLL